MTQDAGDDRGPLLFGVALVLLVVSTVTIILRSYVRICVLRIFHWEDWMALATMLCFAWMCVCVFYFVAHGGGKHTVDVSLSDQVEALKAKWLGEIAYILSTTFLKLTVGLFLVRICCRRWQKGLIWTTLSVALLFNVIFVFIALLQCRPLDYYWLRIAYTDLQGKCQGNGMAFGAVYAASAVNGVADWVLGLLPVALVWGLELGKREKFSVASVLALGILASTAIIIRIPYVGGLVIHDNDYLYDFTDFTIWSLVEAGLGLIAACVATLRPLFRKPGEFSSSQNHPGSGDPSLAPTSRRSRSSARSSWARFMARKKHSLSVGGERDIEMSPRSCRHHSGDWNHGREQGFVRPPLQAYVREGRERSTSNAEAGWDDYFDRTTGSVTDERVSLERGTWR